MFRIWTIRFVVVLTALTSTWLIQGFAVAQVSGTAHERFLADTPKKAALAGIDFLNKQFSSKGVTPENLREMDLSPKAPKPKSISPDPLRNKESDSIERKKAPTLSEKEVEDLRAKMAKGADKYAQNLGFDSAAEAARAKLGFFSATEAARARDEGSGLRVKLVRAKELKNFKEKDDPNLLLEDTYIEIFPIYAQKEGAEKLIKSSITVAQVLYKNENKWHWIERGSPGLIKKYEKYNHLKPDTLVKLVIMGDQTTFLRFLGVGKDEEFKLIPIYNVTLFEDGLELVQLKEGEEKPASQIFSQLAPYAAKILKGQKDDSNMRLLR